MSFLEESIRRRAFLGSIATSAAGIAAMGLSSRLLADDKAPAMPAMPPSASNTTEFEQWIGKIKGKHRQVFDAPSINAGLPLAWARVFQLTNEQVGAPAQEVTGVVVLRHDAIPIAMNSDMWTKYSFPDQFKAVNMITKEKLTSNVFWKPQPGQLPLPGMALNELLDSGVLVGVCDMALTVNAMHFAEKMKMTPTDIKKDWVASIFPGVVIVPSGVLAVNRAQEAGCTYCYAGEG